MRHMTAMLVLIVTLGGAVLPASAQDVRPEDVRRAIDTAVRWLKREQLANGGWRYLDPRFGIGADALVTLSLLNAGVPARDPDLARSLSRIAADKDEYTYNAAMKIAALVAADPARYRQEIQTAANFLSRTQLSNGMWTYAASDVRASLGRGDHSNTQFALYGLHEAAQAGARIDRVVWGKASQHWVGTQCNDGGWAYTSTQAEGYGSMTAAGVASLIICGNQVTQALERPYNNGEADRCGRYVTPQPLAGGLNWLAENFDVRRNPKHHAYHYYWLYAVERVGILSGLKYFGSHDWYREGAAFLVSHQQGDGAWNSSVVDTAFALLFLSKGRRPVLINKLRYTDDHRWNLDRHDCENIVAFLGDRLGEPVSWQVVPLDGDVRDWLDAPILYFNGHDFPKFQDGQTAKMRKYVEAGGTILAEACCSREAFKNGFTEWAEKTFEGSPLRKLGPEHPVWNSLFELKPGKFELWGIDYGCRTSVIFAPVDLSCLWEQMSHPQSQEAFQLAANIAAYATGREALRDKLDVVTLPVERREDGADKPATAALQFAHLIHDGDWRTDAHALPRLAELMREKARVDVVTQAVALRGDDPKLRAHPVAYMTGHYRYKLSAKEIDGLRTYLERGGFLFADACCGRDPFDQSFQEMCAELFPDKKLEPLPSDHEIVRGSPGFDLTAVSFRPMLTQEQPSLKTPQLQGIRVNGRLAVVYSRWGFTCGLEDHHCYACRGLDSADAQKLAVNIVLYAMSH